MKTLVDYIKMNEAQAEEKVYVVKDTYDGAILSMFSTKEDAEQEKKDREAENPNLKLEVSEEKKSDYIDQNEDA